MKKVKELLFGKKTNQNSTTTVTKTESIFRTTYPPHQPSQWEWMREFRVGMLSDRRIIHLN